MALRREHLYGAENGQTLDAFFDRLLNGFRQGVGGDGCFARETPCARVVARDGPSIQERSDQLLGEERVCFGRFIEPLREVRAEVLTSHDGLDELAVFGC